MENNKLESKKHEILQAQLNVHKEQDKRAGLLLYFAMVLTGLLYFMFMKHLYLGEAITWGAYFHEWHSALDFILMFVIVVMSAVFLAWVKHHAYLHFGLYGSVALVLFTVIGFAIFAEFFSSSASQDTKSRVLLQDDKTYQSTLAPVASTSPALLGGGGNAAAIAKAEQTYARCKANLGNPGYKHCDGDKATLDSLKASDAAALQAARDIAVSTNTATLQMTYDRQDKLKADSYNAVIVSTAKFISALNGADYKDNIKTAIVMMMLIVAIAFEILHHFLSKAKERAQNAVYGLELELAKYDGQPLPKKPESVLSENNGASNKTGMGFTAPAWNNTTASYSPALPDHDKPVFKYQQKIQAEPERQPFGFVPARKSGASLGAENRRKYPQTIVQPSGTRETLTYRDELRKDFKGFRDTALGAHSPTPAPPANQKSGGTGLQNPVLGTAEQHYPLPLPQGDENGTDARTVRATRSTSESRSSPCTVHVGAQGKPFTESRYEELKAMVMKHEIEPTFRPVKAVLSGWQIGVSDRNRQVIAAAALDRMHRDKVLMLNPANDGSGIQKAKYILA